MQNKPDTRKESLEKYSSNTNDIGYITAIRFNHSTNTNWYGQEKFSSHHRSKYQKISDI